MKRPYLFLAALLASNLHAAQVTNVIDSFATTQLIGTNIGTITETIVSTNAIGGYRTMMLSVPTASFVPTFLGVDGTIQQLALATPDGVASSFQVIWGGSGGTNGLGGADFGGGQPLDLFSSVLSFSLVSTDQTNNFTWTFTDAASNTATYNGSFPTYSSTNPALPYNITLGSFSNATGINWNNINSIVLSGGNSPSVDVALDAPIRVIATTVPEPGTWTLLLSGLAVIILVLRRTNKSRA